MYTPSNDDKIKRPNRFDPPGMNYKAKLIGIEDVPDPRGDKMCQVAMAKQKAAVVAMGEHKQRITVNVSLDGIKIMDDKAENVLHHHPVHRISFISRDLNDYRAFGYVYNREDGNHQFFGVKTEKAAEPLVMSLRDLFQTVVDMKKEKDKQKENTITIVTPEEKEKSKEASPPVQNPPASNDLLGLDSGVSQTTTTQSNAWLNSNLFPNDPAGAQRVSQPGAVPVNPYLPQGVTMAAMTSNPYQQQQQQPYMQQVPGMSGAPFGSYPAAFPPPQNAAGVGAWQPRPQPPAAVATANQSWMSFDSSTQVSSIFGDLSPATGPQTTTGSAGATMNFSAAPIQPTSLHHPNDPFAPAASFPDPFADIGVLSSQTMSPHGKKASKEDFIKEPPKPTLLDLSQKQQTGVDLATDPFAAVSLPRYRSHYNPFESPPAQSMPAPSTLDKSRAVYSPVDAAAAAAAAHGASAQGSSVNQQQRSNETRSSQAGHPDNKESPAPGQVSRPRPHSSTGTRPAMLLPLTPKNNDPFGISSS